MLKVPLRRTRKIASRATVLLTLLALILASVLTVPAAAGAAPLPKTCAEVHQQNPAATDGEYILNLLGHTAHIYCANLASTPAEYITLAHTGGNYNYSFSPGAHVVYYTRDYVIYGHDALTNYRKVRINPTTLVVDQKDVSFADLTSIGANGSDPQNPNFNPTPKTADYANASDCYNLGSALGRANVDLTGTDFAIDDSVTFAVQGWAQNGTVAMDKGRQVVNMTGGGWCGGAGPTGPLKMKLVTPLIPVDTTAPVTTASAPTGWQNQPVTVTLSATDVDDAVAATYSQLDGAAAQQGTSVVISTEGTHTLAYWSVDSNGNTEGKSTFTVNSTTEGWQDTGIDLPPNSQVSFTASGTATPQVGSQPYYGPAGNGQPAAVNRLVPGVSDFSLVGKIGSGAGLEVGSSATLNTGSGGRLYLGYNDCGGCYGDNAGTYTVQITAPHKSAQIQIDLTAPVTSVVSGAPGSTGVTVTLQATDNLSGVANTYAQVDNGPVQTGTTVLVTGGGTHTLSYWSVDKAGNTETPKTAQVYVDQSAVAPAITSATAGYVSGKPTLSGTAEPNSTVNIYLDTDPSNSNLALHQPVVQSSNDYGSDGSGAVSGTLTGGFQAHTGNELSPWWQVDLGQVSSIDSFVVWNRIDCCAYREDTLSILVSNDGTNWQQVGGANGSRFGGINPNNGLLIQGLDAAAVTRSGLIGPLKVYGQGVAARYVRLQTTPPGGNYLNFDQFQAFGTKATPVATVKADASGNWSANLSGLSTGSHQVFVKSYGAAATAVSSATMTVDATAPTITGAATPAPNAAGWNNGQVKVHFTCADAESGVASCSPDAFLNKEGTNQSATGTAVDNVGNTATTTVSGINIDLTPPVTTATAPTGWQNKPATVTFTATDNLSGVAGTYSSVDGGAAQPGNSVTISTDGKHTVSYYSMDKAGNAEGGAATHNLQVPVNSPNGWYDTGIDVVAGSTLNISASGIAYYCGGCAIDPNGRNQPSNQWLVPNAYALALVGKIGNGSGFNVGASYSGVAAGSGRLYLAMNDCVGCFGDNYGAWNATVTTTNSLTVMVDQTPPTISGTASTTAWTNQPVKVTFTCADATSGVQSCQAPITVSTEGANQSVTGNATDKAGNTASATVSGINIDKTAPVTTISAPTSWQNNDVPVTFTATDNLSGVAATYYTVDGGALQTGTSLTLSTEGVHTLTYWSVDKARNAEAAHTATVKIDKTAPTISGATDRAANAAGWYNADVTVTFTCADALSGVATCSAPSTLTEGANQSVTGNAADVAGNTASATVSSINVDKTPPTITGATDHAANSNGWYNAAVTVTYTCGDALSGVATCTAPVTLGTEGASQSTTGTATDKAGNTASATVSGINIDLTPPTITGATDRAANTAGWYNADVKVSFTCGDALSGVDTCSAPTTLSAEGANQSVTGNAADKAGNPASATVSGINIDKTAPVTTIEAPATWQNQDVPVTFTATDNLSGVATTYYTVDGGAQQTGTSLTLSTEGSHTVTYWSVDKAGNAESAHTAIVKIDKTPPTISGATDRAANANGWYKADVTVTFTCADPISGGAASGVASCSAPTTLKEGASQSVTGNAADVAGNTASATVSGINIDETPPTISGKTDRAANGFGWYNAPVTVTFACADSLSGIDTGRSDTGCGGSTTLNQDGAAQSVTGAATDKAGNTASATVSGINIDQTAPIIAISFAGTTQDGAYVNSVTPNIKVDDALSGIDSSQTVITLNGAPFTSGTAVTAPGSYTLTVTIADKAGNPATQTVQFKVRHTTALKYVGDTTADYNDPATLKAVLTDTSTATPAALGGQSVSLSVGSQICSATGDNSGLATCGITPNVVAGTYPIGVSYAGSDLYYASTTSGSFTVNKEETALHITSSSTLNTNNVVVTAQLQEDGTTAIAGRTVTFTAVGSNGTTVTGTGVTDATGKATATLNLSPDQYSLSASFAGDGYYVASSDKQTLYVYQQTQFVIWGGNAGGLQTGADYNFWGAQWSKQVTGGNYTAGASFKGYADIVSGATWTATPGGSSTPPASVAKYISVLVATQATKSGSGISGNVFETVVLKVDATPAYGPSPSTPGSGILITVVH